jgi:hypothetical protein
MSEPSVWMVERMYKDGTWQFVGKVWYSKEAALDWLAGIRHQYRKNFRIFRWDRSSKAIDTGSDA